MLRTKARRLCGHETRDTEFTGPNAVIVTESTALLTRDHRLQVTSTAIGRVIIVVVIIIRN